MLKEEYCSPLSFLSGKDQSPDQTGDVTCAAPQTSERSVLGWMGWVSDHTCGLKATLALILLA